MSLPTVVHNPDHINHLVCGEDEEGPYVWCEVCGEKVAHVSETIQIEDPLNPDLPVPFLPTDREIKSKYEVMLTDLLYILKCYGFVTNTNWEEIFYILTSTKREGWDGLMRMGAEVLVAELVEKWDKEKNRNERNK